MDTKEWILNVRHPLRLNSKLLSDNKRPLSSVVESHWPVPECGSPEKKRGMGVPLVLTHRGGGFRPQLMFMGEK